MKRSNPSSGKKTHVPSDFKRLKAKVGKRAPQKANATDLKFRTASVQVRSQTIVTNAGKATSNKEESEEKRKEFQQEMVSSKGKQLPQLLAQLNHSSPNIRIASLQGIKDAIKHTSNEAVPNYLSFLVPSLTKSIVDDDSKVRKLARSIFFQDICARILTNQDNDKMRPFLPIALAYIASGLHSLDQDVRYDGCMAIETLCTDFGSDFSGDKEFYSLFTTIPAFVTLFDDVSGGAASVARRGMGDAGSMKRSSKNSTKKPKGETEKKKKSSSSDKSIGVLRSFISLMKVTTLSGQEDVDVDKTWVLNSDVMKRLAPNGPALLPSFTLPNLMFLPGGMASNALVWNNTDSAERRKERKPKSAVKDLNDLSLMVESSRINQSVKMANKSLSITTQIDLLSKLRNRFVEVTQQGNQRGNGGLLISPHDIHECSLLISASRLLWNCHPRFFDNEKEANRQFLSKDGKVNERKKFKKLANILLSMLLEVLPIQDPSGNPANKHNFDLLNSSLCCAISEFGSVLKPPRRSDVDNERMIDSSNNTVQWVDAIFSYLLPKLTDDEDDDLSKGDAIPRRQHNSRVTLMKVVEQLLLTQESGIRFLEDEEKQMELLTTFATLFFSNTNKPNEQMCRSLEGRRAVYILISLIAQYFREASSRNEDEESNRYDSERWKVLSEMATVLPIYLIMWRGSFEKDSTLILSTLLSIARRCDVSSTECTSYTSKFCNSVRESIIFMFTTSSMIQHDCNGSTAKSDISVFEELPTYITKKLAISLLGILRYPSKILVLSLAQICVRRNADNESRLNDDITDYIMSVLHSMKDTFSYEQYSAFLIESIGFSRMDLHEIIEARGKKGVDEDRDGSASDNSIICSCDKALARSCRYLCLLLNEDKRIVDTLKPYLITWLKGSSDESILLRKLKARAVITIVSCWSILETEKSCYFHLEQDLKTSILNVICDLFLSSSNSFRIGNSQVISPIMTLFRLHPSLLCSVLSECGKKVLQYNGKDTDNSKPLISSLLFLASNNSLLETIRQKDVSEVMMNTACTIEKSTSNGPLEMIAGTLTIQVKSILGFK